MNITVFGLSITSAWGNGHAALLRGLFRALHGLGHRVEFFELDTPYYAAHRDTAAFPYVRVHLYSSWEQVLPEARLSLARSDVAMVTSYCPDGMQASELIAEYHNVRTIFYDMDTPVTLFELDRGNRPSYLPRNGLNAFDLVLSYTGGQAVALLKKQLDARRVEPLYGWVDPEVYTPQAPSEKYDCSLSYLGTYSADRHRALEALLIEPARAMPDLHFIIAGAMYPDRERWPANITAFEHLSPPEHATFYSSSALTLNITRGTMARMGYCPSGRLFEAAACGTPVVSDYWEGLNCFFEPGEEILIAESCQQVVSLLKDAGSDRTKVGRRARERALASHTAEQRALRFIELIESTTSSTGPSLSLCQGVN